VTEVLPAEHRGPGLVDLQVNGYAGFDFNSRPESWRPGDFPRVRAALAGRGVVAALPTFITDAPERLVARAAAYARLLAERPELEATFPKLHIEGPFISAEDGPRGAHPLAHCRAPRDLPDLLDRLREASGDRIGILTLAPELRGALELISRATAQGICVAIGHTAAAPEVIAEAVAAGARMSTHLGNGSHWSLPRHENYIQAQLAEDGLVASFIADGHHLPWYVLKNFVRAKTPARSVLVTDAISAAGAGPGRFTLGDDEVEVSAELRVTRPGKPGFAGSALTLDRAVINAALHCGVSFEEAWEMASTRAAGLVGLGPLPEVEVAVDGEGRRFRRTTSPLPPPPPARSCPA
jgi:N-acetylglucosamine-6-phosphate deacetylase